jgi:hypothetical protein
MHLARTPLRTPGTARRPRRRVVALVAMALALALVGAACKQLDPANRAAGVPAVTNGKLPMSYLASSKDGCVVYDEAIVSFNAMVAAAARDGVKLRGIGCYRNYANQVIVRDDWCSRGQCDMAAVPGTSNHGWGKAVDFADQSGELTFDSVGYAWLKAWAGFYGWIHPAVMEPDGPIPEPWHWEWVGDGGKMFLGQYFGIGNAPMAEPRGLPFGSVDAVSPVPGGVAVAGWAIDPDQVASIPVHVYVDSAGYAIMANTSRPDVNAVYPLFADAQHGFSSVISAAPGPHRVCVYAINVSGTGSNRLIRCVDVVVPATPAPASAAAPASSSAPTTTSTTAAPAPAPTTTTTTVAPAPSTSSTSSTSTTVASTPAAGSAQG